ncbi:MAG: 9-O-acetylesterase [Candidatus Hydrogenedentes bacterium]|nr:9-O-acetylesterase [Candidatus Hydrogenedentota bacterium]
MAMAWCLAVLDQAQASAGALRVSGMFGDHMVLQRGQPVPVWGWATPGMRVIVSLAEQEQVCTADSGGAWRVVLSPLSAGGPHELVVSSEETIRFSDVLVGDVWICSGQSNMEMHMRPGPDAVYNAEQEVAGANYPGIRLFTVPRTSRFEPQTDIQTEGWSVCSPDSVLTFSAVGYFFGRNLHEHLKVPIGLINSSKGASPAEAWTSTDALRSLPEFWEVVEELPARIAQSQAMFPEYSRQSDLWNRLLEERDAGQVDGKALWATPDFDDSRWRTMPVPEFWENAGYPDFDGVMWFRRAVELPLDWTGRPLKLGLCTVNDMDRAYINGVEVGRFESASGWTAPRVYDIPPQCAMPGPNMVAVRVFDVGNKGGLCGSSDDLWIRRADAPSAAPVSLAGEWRLNPGLDLKSIPPKPAPPPLLESNHRTPGVLFNAMVAPMIPFAVKGVIWYQGESNTGRAGEYAALFPAMIQDWRSRWAQDSLPFLFVQLASIGQGPPEPVDDNMSRLREAQTKALALPDTAMVVTIDIGDPVNGHPRNKQDVGRRLAAAAQRVAYGENLVAWGPLFKECSIEGDAVRIRFDSTGGGLVASDGRPLRGFAISGEDRMFVWADAHIEGDAVVVSSSHVMKPVAVRYAWSSYPDANLCNAEGFPASPFRTDSWPQKDTQDQQPL